MSKIYTIIGKLKEKGFFHIFGSSFLNQVITFLSGFILVRVLEQSAYGAYTCAYNIYSIFHLFSGLGMVSAVLQVCSEKREDKERYYNFGFLFSIICNIVLMVVIVIWAKMGTVQIEDARNLLALLSVSAPLSIIYEFIQVYFRYNLENKKYSYFTTMNSALILGGSVIGAILGDAIGLTICRSLGYIISIIVGVGFFKFPIATIKPKLKLSRSELKDIFGISIISMVNVATGQVLYLLDVNVVGTVLKDANVIASYKVATLIPNALLFLPAALMTYYYPLFAQNKDNITWVKIEYKRILTIFGALNIIIAIICCFSAELIIKLIFGETYIECIPIFRVLMVGYVFSATFRKIVGNVLVTQRKLGVNFAIGIFECILNIILNYSFVTKYGAIGAAYATLIVAIISSVIGQIYFYLYLKKKKIMNII